MSNAVLPGLHHLTAIASDAQANVNFYAGVLGLRLVKKTINYDDPGTYHLYYGDAEGSPGTILTFFPWPGAHAGRKGTGQATVTSLAIPEGSLGFWRERFHAHSVQTGEIVNRFGEQALPFMDPDGLGLELVTRPGLAPNGKAWTGGGVSAGHAILGMDGVTLTVRDRKASEQMLQTLGFTHVGDEANRVRYRAHGSHGHGAHADLLIEHDATFPHGSLGAGVVHHVAWRTPSDETEMHWRETLTSEGVGVSPVMDRQYFHSIYFHEPGGVLFEIATDPPGFTADEPLDRLGATLRLPEWLEKDRARLEAALPPLKTPEI